MKNVGDVKKVYQAAELLEDFCSETACRVCSIVKLCNWIFCEKPIVQAIMERIRNYYLIWKERTAENIKKKL